MARLSFWGVICNDVVKIGGIATIWHVGDTNEMDVFGAGSVLVALGQVTNFF
jgi:hypothetical protein